MSAPQACVIGWPVRHSRSPLIHGYWLNHYGIAGSYEKREVPPDLVEQFLLDLPVSSFIGCNVTLPHKEMAFKTVTLADEATSQLGVVNTVYVRDGRVFGTSTDGEGFIQNLMESRPGLNLRGKHISLLGAGGAARAIVGALLANGAAEITVVNRTPERSEILRRDFGRLISLADWSDRNDAITETDLLVNTTSLGMNGQPPLDISLARLPSHAVVTDIIYVPLETPLLTRAREQGNPVVPGLGMLLYQAVRGFELWFGKRPTVTSELYALLAADIEKWS